MYFCFSLLFLSGSDIAASLKVCLIINIIIIILSDYTEWIFVIFFQDNSFRQEIEQFPELGLLILDAMQEAEIDNTCERIKKRRRTTDSTGENGSALVPRQVCVCVCVCGVFVYKYMHISVYLCVRVYIYV